MTTNIEDIRILLKLSPQAETVMNTLTAGMSVSIDETEQADMTVFAEVWLKNSRVQQRIGEAI